MTTVTQPAAVVPRDRYGRPGVKHPDTGRLIYYRRCTTFIDVLEDRWALEAWKQRMVAIGLATRPDLLLKAAAANGDKAQLNQVIDAAREAGGATQAATTGSAVHAITEQLDRGQDPIIPPAAQPDIDAYKQATAHLRMAEIEVFVVHDQFQVGGTFDRVVELDGRRYVADIKTGNIDYGQSKIAMQLAVYANSDHYDPATGARTPLDVDKARGLVIHLPAGAGECTLHWADLDSGLEGMYLAAEVWDWRRRTGLLEATPPGPDLLPAIAAAPDRDALVALWAANQHRWDQQAQAATEARLRAIQTPSLTTVS